MNQTQRRHKFLIFALTCTLLGAVGTRAQAAADWDDFVGDHLWSTDNNWLGGHAPFASDSTFIKVGAIQPGGTGPIIDSSTTAVARRLSLEVQSTGETVSMTMTGGTLDLYFPEVNNIYFRLGAGSGPGTAVFDMSGGTMTIDVDEELYAFETNGYVRVGSGYSGLLNMSNDATIEAWDLLVRDDGLVDLSDAATIILKGDDTAALQGYIDAGTLTTNGGTGVPSFSYDAQSDLTTIVVSSIANADFDSDSDVDGADFLIWQRGVGVGTTLAEGDANGDQVVDATDLGFWQDQFGTVTPAVAATASVPEPTSLALLVPAALMLLSFNKRRKQTIEV